MVTPRGLMALRDHPVDAPAASTPRLKFRSARLEGAFQAEVGEARTRFDRTFFLINVTICGVFDLLFLRAMVPNGVVTRLAYDIMLMAQGALMTVVGRKWPAYRRDFLSALRLGYGLCMAAGVMDWTVMAEHRSSWLAVELFKVVVMGGGTLIGLWLGAGLQTDFASSTLCLLGTTAMVLPSSTRVCREIARLAQLAQQRADGGGGVGALLQRLAGEGAAAWLLPAVCTLQFAMNCSLPALGWITARCTRDQAALAEAAGYRASMRASHVRAPLLLALTATALFHFVAAVALDASQQWA